MTDKEKQLAWDRGFKAYWNTYSLYDCPEDEQELQEEWRSGWFTAQSADNDGL